jgi:signal transduction histidine kinase
MLAMPHTLNLSDVMAIPIPLYGVRARASSRRMKKHRAAGADPPESGLATDSVSRASASHCLSIRASLRTSSRAKATSAVREVQAPATHPAREHNRDGCPFPPEQGGYRAVPTRSWLASQNTKNTEKFLPARLARPPDLCKMSFRTLGVIKATAILFLSMWQDAGQRSRFHLADPSCCEAAMLLESKICELEWIATALRVISQEIRYRGVAEALLAAALEYSGAVRGAVMLRQDRESPEQADADFPHDGARLVISHPPASTFQLAADLNERVLARRETVVKHEDSGESTFTNRSEPARQPISLLCLPLSHQGQTIGALYLESKQRRGAFEPRCVSVISILAAQAAVSFASVQLFEALRETNLWMAKGQEIGRMGGYWWNTRTQLSRVSRELYRIFDIDPDVNPVPFDVFKGRVHPDDFPALERAIEEAVRAKSPFSHEYRVVHKDGTTLHVVAIGQVDVGPSGDVELQGSITDVTEQKASEQALRDAKAALARAARLASLGELAGSIIHEVSQPLTGIMMSAEACIQSLERHPADPAEARKSAIRIVHQARRASEVVDGLRSLARDATLNFTDVQMNEVIEEVILLSKRELERAGVTLRTELDASMPRIDADRVQIQQVVLNLVRNAINAMAGVEGRPRVLTAASKVTDGYALVSIADTGVGIDPAIRERLFEPLYTTKRDGLGLGLSICRKIVGAHGGHLWAEPNATQGTTFAFTLPLRQSIISSENNKDVPLDLCSHH